MYRTTTFLSKYGIEELSYSAISWRSNAMTLYGVPQKTINLYQAVPIKFQWFFIFDTN